MSVIYVADQKIWESLPASDHVIWDGGLLMVQDFFSNVKFAYAMKPGQYAKVQNLDGGTVVKIND